MGILLAVILLVFVFKVLELERYLSLEFMKSSRESFGALYARHRFLVIASYMIIYISVTSLSLPGAAVLTLAGGALFGVIVGTVVVSFASTIGATLACFVSRFILREWVQNKFGEKLKAVNRGIEKEGAFYLFTLRLIPAFPFFMINLVMGLTRMRFFTFYWVSQVGMLAGTIVYVNAGRQLAKIDSISGIFSPSVIISFVILGLFPITVKKLVDRYRSGTKRALKTGHLTSKQSPLRRGR